jgi:methylmalonyl-CoA epimerase
MSYIRRIDRVALAVTDLDDAQRFFEDWFGAEFKPEEVIEQTGVRYRPFKIGESMMELLQATREDSPVAKFLKAHGGPGVHHITFEVDDLDLALEELEQRGGRVVSRQEYPAGVTFEGHIWREAFVHPKDAFGVLIHLAEKRAASDESHGA